MESPAFSCDLPKETKKKYVRNVTLTHTEILQPQYSAERSADINSNEMHVIHKKSHLHLLPLVCPFI